MDDEPKVEQLENRIETLEATIAKMLPGRRDALKMGGAALVGGSLMASTASAGTNQVGTIGSASQPVDLETEDINNADTVTTKDLVVTDTATGPFGSALQGCRVFLSNGQNLAAGSLDKIQFDSVEYDSGSNFDTNTHNFVCPSDGIYYAKAHLNFDGGGNSDDRLGIVGNSSTTNPEGEGSRTRFKDSGSGIELDAATMNKYASGDTITAYALNIDSSDSLRPGNQSSETFFEVVFLGGL